MTRKPPARKRPRLGPDGFVAQKFGDDYSIKAQRLMIHRHEDSGLASAALTDQDVAGWPELTEAGS